MENEYLGNKVQRFRRLNKILYKIERWVSENLLITIAYIAVILALLYESGFIQIISVPTASFSPGGGAFSYNINRQTQAETIIVFIFLLIGFASAWTLYTYASSKVTRASPTSALVSLIILTIMFLILFMVAYGAVTRG